ncbi:MAG: hypothetical protein LE180_00960 [Endomicrobium sp.]|uniref:FmdB family zinc ribbon protein n=1 Tax=Candidatus Endomicrobiellum pyrsonymphae TaxID=1408203 RepID=UPI00358C1581|nr:hypothetical protein [Endomicrobium sp.]
MPLFEFVCRKCNKKFEVLVFCKDSVICPECQSNEVVKQFSSFVAKSSLSNCVATGSCPAVSERKHKCSSSCCCH